MTCHECLMAGGIQQPVTALCRYCFVALCKEHLVELYRDAPTFPQYSCHHKPGTPVASDEAGRRAPARGSNGAVPRPVFQPAAGSA